YRTKTPNFGSGLPGVIAGRPRGEPRIREINRLLNDPASQLRRGLHEADRLSHMEGELAATERLRALQSEYAELLPGEAGWNMLWAFPCRAAPPVFDAVFTLDGPIRRDVFTEPTIDDPAPRSYKSPHKEPGRHRAYASRRAWRPRSGPR